MPQPSQQPQNLTFSTTRALGPVGGVGGAGGAPPGTPPGTPPLPPPPQAPDVQASRNAQLQGVQDEYKKYVEGIQAGTGHVLDLATSRSRDAAAGAKQRAREDAQFRGVNSAQAERDVEDSAQRTLAGQHAAIALEREKMIGEGLKTEYDQESGHQQLGQGEKRIGLDAYNSYQNAMQAYNAANLANSTALFNQLQAVLQAKATVGAGQAGGTLVPASGPGAYAPSLSSLNGGRNFGGARR